MKRYHTVRLLEDMSTLAFLRFIDILFYSYRSVLPCCNLGHAEACQTEVCVPPNSISTAGAAEDTNDYSRLL